MPKGMQPIYRQVLGSNTTSVLFNNIPQTFTDLKMVVRGRVTASNVGTVFANINAGTAYTGVTMYGETTGQGAFGIGTSQIGYLSGPNYGSVGISSVEAYIANYKSNGIKMMISNGASEANSLLYQAGVQSQTASTILSLAPVVAITFTMDAGSFEAGTSFTLYGIGA